MMQATVVVALCGALMMGRPAQALDVSAARRPAQQRAAALAATTRRQALFGGAVVAAGTLAAPPAEANGLFGTKENIIGVRLPEYATTENGAIATVDEGTRASLVADAQAFYALEPSLRAGDGNEATAVQKFFVGEWATMRADVGRAATAATPPSKAITKNGSGFVSAVELIRESYNVGSFDLAAKQYDFAAQLLDSLLAKLAIDKAAL